MLSRDPALRHRLGVVCIECLPRGIRLGPRLALIAGGGALAVAVLLVPGRRGVDCGDVLESAREHNAEVPVNLP